VCVCVCLSVSISPELYVQSSQFFCVLPMTILCISGFMDDDIVADNGQEYRRREEACTLKAIHLVPSFSGDGANASRGSRGVIVTTSTIYLMMLCAAQVPPTIVEGPPVGDVYFTSDAGSRLKLPCRATGNPQPWSVDAHLSTHYIFTVTTNTKKLPQSSAA